VVIRKRVGCEIASQSLCSCFIANMEPAPTSSELLRDMVAALADGAPVLHVSARFSASTGFSTSKVRSIYYNGRGERSKLNANSLLSATEDQALLYAAQACSYANFALSRS